MRRDFGTQSTIADRLIILGSASDHISSGDSNDTVYGGDGDDTIFGNQGNDLIRGGTGTDSIHAGTGNDTVFGEAGDDIIYGGSDGNDQLSGGADADNFLIPDDGAGIDTVTDFVAGVDDISVTSSTMAIARRPLSAIGTETATTSAGATNGIEIADNDVHYISLDGQAGALTIDGTATLTSADLAASTLTNLAAYLDERFTNSVATGASGDVDAIMVVNWTAPSSTVSYVYEFTENAASVNISGSELALLGIIERSSTILTIGDVI
jgi:Ca2+-binding RTX toxin-like protein